MFLFSLPSFLICPIALSLTFTPLLILYQCLNGLVFSSCQRLFKFNATNTVISEMTGDACNYQNPHCNSHGYGVLLLSLLRRFIFFFGISGYLSLLHCSAALLFEAADACYKSYWVKTCIALRDVIKLSVSASFLYVFLSNVISPKGVGRLFLHTSSMVGCFI